MFDIASLGDKEFGYDEASTEGDNISWYRDGEVYYRFTTVSTGPLKCQHTLKKYHFEGDNFVLDEDLTDRLDGFCLIDVPKRYGAEYHNDLAKDRLMALKII